MSPFSECPGAVVSNLQGEGFAFAQSLHFNSNLGQIDNFFRLMWQFSQIRIHVDTSKMDDYWFATYSPILKAIKSRWFEGHITSYKAFAGTFGYLGTIFECMLWLLWHSVEDGQKVGSVSGADAERLTSKIEQRFVACFGEFHGIQVRPQIDISCCVVLRSWSQDFLTSSSQAFLTNLHSNSNSQCF